MDAIQFLKREHEKAKAMFGRIEQARDGERGQLWRTLAPELKAHEQMEEAYLYGPVARDAGSRDRSLVKWEQHHRKEVGEAESMIRKIDGMDPTDQAWLGQVRQLRSTLEHHIQEEEGKIWPKIRQVWDAQKLEQAGGRMEAQKGKGERAA
jgi:hemerythrin superfamily protein